MSSATGTSEPITIVKRYDSIAAYVARAKELDAPMSYSRGDTWDQGVSGTQACERALAGDLTLAAEASALADKIEASTIEGTVRYANISGVAGTRVNVPVYLANHPSCFVRRAKSERATRHVTIYVSLVCSAGIPAESMIKRGCAVLGLLTALQCQQYGVDLYLLGETSGPHMRGSMFQIIRVDSQPLDVSSAAFALAHPAFARNVLYMVQARENAASSTGWPHDFQQPFGDSAGYMKSAYGKRVRDLLGMTETDVWAPAAYIGEESIQDPIGWINKCLVQVGGDHV